MENFTIHEESGVILHKGRVVYMNGNPIKNPDIIDHSLIIRKYYTPDLNIVSVKGHVDIIGKDIDHCFEYPSIITHLGLTYQLDGSSHIIDVGGKKFAVSDTEINEIKPIGKVPYMETFIITDKINYCQISKYRYIFSYNDENVHADAADIFDYTVGGVNSGTVTLFNDTEKINCAWGYDRDGLCLYDYTNKRRLNIAFKAATKSEKLLIQTI